jgi:hypothetical protein
LAGAELLKGHLVLHCQTVHHQVDDPGIEFPAYSATFDGKALAVGEHLQVAPRVTFTRRC